MSLLLDALKKAAQEKLDRQNAEQPASADPAASARYEADGDAHAGPEGDSEHTEYATHADPADTLSSTLPGGETTVVAETAYTRHEDTRTAGATELELEPADRDRTEPGPEATGFDTQSAVTDTPDEPGFAVTTDELDAYLADGTGTTRRRDMDETRFGESDRTDPTYPTYRHSLTENMRMENAAYGYQAAGSPDQAARIFTSKAAPAADRTRLFALIGLAVVAALLLAGLFGYEYIAELNQSDMMYASPRERLGDRRIAQDDPVSESSARAQPEEPIDPALLIEQEDYSELFQDTVARYEAESPGDAGADTASAAPGDERPAERPASTAAAPPQRRSAPARQQTQAGRPGEFSIAHSQPNGAEALRETLMRAWRAYNRGELDTAEVAYKQALNRSPRNRDALLGLAAIHQVRGETARARQRYRRLLELDPRDDLALAGLTSLAGAHGEAAAGQTPQDISRIKTLLADRPQAAHLHFTLGNLYAAERRWADAQQAYFDAYRLADDNPDYAFNLAVSLEHLGQPEAAARFYRQALQASRSRRANFQPAALQTRIDSLSSGHAASQTQP